MFPSRNESMYLWILGPAVAGGSDGEDDGAGTGKGIRGRVRAGQKLCRGLPLAFTLCFRHPHRVFLLHGFGNGRLLSPCVFVTETLVKKAMAT